MEVTKFTPRELPQLADLHHNINEAFKNDSLNLLLAQPVSETWIKKHPLIKVKNKDGKYVPMRYIPIDKIRFLLLKIFGEYRREIISVTHMVNGIVAIVRLHVRHPFTGEWSYHDGVGGAPIQQDSGAETTDLNAVKKNAIQIAAPMAVSYATKSAAKCLGRLFGADLNQDGVIEFTGSYQNLKKEDLDELTQNL